MRNIAPQQNYMVNTDLDRVLSFQHFGQNVGKLVQVVHCVAQLPEMLLARILRGREKFTGRVIKQGNSKYVGALTVFR